MTSLLYYLIQVIIASGILFLYYHFFLRNKRFHQYNRFFLMSTVVLSIIIPFLHIPVYFTHEETSSSILIRTLTILGSTNEGVQVNGENINALKDQGVTIDLISILYTLIACFVLIRIIVGLVRIKRLGNANPVEKIGNIRFVNTSDAQAPFSFFNWLFWHNNIELKSEKGEQVFRHELFHIRQKHSLDVIFMELVSMVFWINPFFYLIKKEIRAIHEFLADQYALDKCEQWNYAETLLMHALQTKQSLVNPFFHNQIKRRIAMITNPQKTSHQYLRKVLVLPVAAVIVTLFAFSYRKNNAGVSLVKNPLSLVIGTVNGGDDPVAQRTNGQHKESDLAVSISNNVLRQNKSVGSKTVPAINAADTVPHSYTINGNINFGGELSFKVENITINTKEIPSGNTFKPRLIVLNGSLLTLDEAKSKFNDVTVRGAEIQIVAANSKDAISKYGERAKEGVVVINNAVLEKPIIFHNILENNSERAPLIVVDGKILSKEEGETFMKSLDNNDIEAVSVFKDVSGTKYQEIGKNGVIEITLKKKPEAPHTKADVPKGSVSGELIITEKVSGPSLILHKQKN